MKQSRQLSIYFEIRHACPCLTTTGYSRHRKTRPRLKLEVLILNAPSSLPLPLRLRSLPIVFARPSPLQPHSAAQNCTDHTVMMFTHPDRKHQPLHPRGAARLYRGGGPSPWAASAATQDFQVGGNAFFPGASSYSGQGGKGGAGKSPGASAGGAAGGVGADGDVTLVEPGKVGGRVQDEGKRLQGYGFGVRRRVRGAGTAVVLWGVGGDVMCGCTYVFSSGDG